MDTRLRQPVAAGRLQADRLRPLGVVRGSASPTLVIPDPTPEQLVFLKREQLRRDHVRGRIMPDGTMRVEYRIYAASAPDRIEQLTPAGRVSMTMRRSWEWDTRNSRRAWEVCRGRRGKVLVRGLRQYYAALVMTGRLTPEQASESRYNL
jgi:hypothetical protein